MKVKVRVRMSLFFLGKRECGWGLGFLVRGRGDLEEMSWGGM